jgi:diguanylate cyclase (GGDEF)-like protein
VTQLRVGAGASSEELARGAATLYAPGAALVYASLALPNPDANRPIVAAMASVALLVAILLIRFGRYLPGWVFPPLVTLGLCLITTIVFAGGPWGYAFACFYIWSGTYAWYFLSGRQAAVQTALAIIAILCVWVTGRATGLYLLMVIGTLLTVCLWLRNAVRGVRHQALTDGLTGVPNRRGWDQALMVAVDRGRRAGATLCVAMLDLDHFKVFNDEHGHQTGDLLLQTAVRGWRSGLRSSDTIARYGGEEFAILLDGCALASAGKIVDDLRKLVPRGLTCSAGVAEWDRRETPEALMLRADAALYEAKRQGRNRAILAPARSLGLNVPAPATLWTGLALEMLREGKVGMVYQPVVRLADRVIIGYEALARPEGVAPEATVDGLFVAAQRMGMTREIDYLCRRNALEGARGLPQNSTLFINISVAALLDPEHDPDQMLFLARLTGRKPHQVVLEISERESITDLPRFAAAIRAYRDIGFLFAVDDVGEGHSTFETLAAATPEYVKLARHFIGRVSEPGPRAAIVAACSFAQASEARVIAEGIEDERTIGVLRDLHVELGQGFHLGRPARLNGRRSDAATEAEALPSALGGWT